MGASFKIYETTGRHAKRAARDLARTEQGSVILLGSTQDVERLRETRAENSGTPAQILALAHSIKPESWIANSLAEAVKAARDFDPPIESIPRGEFEGKPAKLDSWDIGARDIITEKFHEKVQIGVFPTDDPSQVPAYLNAGGWNACPPAENHVALHTYWAENFGAQLQVHTHDVMICTVKRPPTNREAAIDLAIQHFAYCPDIVEQGYGTIDALAANLLHGNGWYFWWD